ncbi:unnamed protein product, partial [Medioppia subpectinata]
MNWFPKERNYKTELLGKYCTAKEATDHPLKPLVVNQTETKRLKVDNSSAVTKTNDAKPTNTSWNGLDPLSMALSLQNTTESNSLDSSLEMDKNAKSSSKDNQTTADFIGEDFEDWSSTKTSILNKYTTSERLSIKTSFLMVGASGSAISGSTSVVRSSANTSVADKVRHRLEQLDDFEE